MSTIVKDIVDAIKTIIAATLPATYAELDYVVEPDKNNYKTNRFRYGVLPLSGESQGGIAKHVNVNQLFEIILTTSFINKSQSDNNQRSKTFDLYEKQWDITKALFTTKLGLPTRVLNVNNLSLSEPEYLDDDHVVVLRFSLSVLYRHTL